MSSPNFKLETQIFFKSLQENICAALEKEDGTGKFVPHIWERDGGGGGRSMVLQEGTVIEKGGVNFSAVEGELPENISKALGVKSNHFFATGVSIVIHPNNPLVLHRAEQLNLLNYRLILLHQQTVQVLLILLDDFQ